MKIRTKYACQSHILPSIRLLTVTLLLVLAAACGETGMPQSGEASSTSLSQDTSIASALYADKRMPEGFYSEKAPDNTFYTISHLKNISILPLVNRAGLPVYDLASNDFSEALAWSDQAAAYQPSYKQLSGNSETPLYYQFTRFDPASPEFIDMQRVFKASVIDFTGVDRNNEDEQYQGRITLTDLTAEKVKMIIEYLWLFTSNNNYSNAILESYTTESAGEFVHIMKQARLNIGYGDKCDSIEVYEVRYTIPRNTGTIQKVKSLDHVFMARRTGDGIEICSE